MGPSVHYFIGKQLLATTSKLPWWGDCGKPPSLLLVCPECGEVWGRVIVEGQKWLPITRPCGKHPTRGAADKIGGSFIANWKADFEELPPEVPRYELEIRLNQFTKERS
jgi:hypothetical protein